MQPEAFLEQVFERRSAPDDGAELLAALRRGEETAYEAVMRRYNQRLFRTARGILSDDAEAEDAVQDAYVRAFLKIGDLKNAEGLGAWLSRIAANEALARLRAAKRRPAPATTTEQSDETLAERMDSQLPTPEQSAATAEVRELIERAIDTLPDDFRAVFMLRAVEQLDARETADCLGIKVETVKTRYHRARNILRIALSRHLTAASVKAFPFAGRRCDRTVARVLQRLREETPHRT